MRNTIVVIMAKGASTRVPKKNITLVGGRPLIHYTFDHVRAMKMPADVVVMTECPEVAACCDGFPVWWETTEQKTPVCRRVEMAVDDLERERGATYDYVVMLNADTPVRPPTLLDDSLRELILADADIVESVVPIPVHYHAYRAFLIRETGDLVPVLSGIDHEAYSQNFPQHVAITGAVFTMKRAVLKSAGYRGSRHPALHFRPIVCDPAQHLEIDTPDDLEAFRKMIEDGHSERLSRQV